VTRGARLLSAAAALALALPGAAAAHGSSAYVATVRGVTPALRGVRARIDDDSIVLTNRSRMPLLVHVSLDGSRTRWVRVARGRTFTWPDARVEWNGAVPPLSVRREPGKSHHVGDWRVPLRAGGRTYAIAGRLDYVVSGTDLAELLFPLAPTPLLLLLAVGVVRRARR
jgi:hypothetical protein